MSMSSDRLSPGDTIREALKLALENNCRVIFVESNAYQYSLLYWFEFICAQLEIVGMHFEPIYSGINSKNARILSMFKQLSAHEVYLHDAVKPFVYPQITSFNALKRDNKDDCLDLLTYAPRVVAEYGGLLLSLTEIEMQDFDALEVIEYNSPF